MSEPPTRVLVVDDDPLVRRGLALLIDTTTDLVVVGEADDGDEVVEAVQRHHPDVVVMDIRMRRVDGITATARVLARPDPPRVLVLTTFGVDRYVLDALRTGAAGFALKDADRDAILDADLVAEGLPNAAVAARPHLSEATVKADVSEVLTALTVDNRVQIALTVRDAE